MFRCRHMTLDDYDTVIELMQRTPGVSVRDADSREATQRYLERNPNLSFVAVVGAPDGERMVGCVMSGHDGRRGYLQHLVVLPDCRRQGIASALVARCLDALAQLGITKSHVDVIKTNELAHAYWTTQRWTRRTDIDRYSFIRGGNANA